MFSKVKHTYCHERTNKDFRTDAHLAEVEVINITGTERSNIQLTVALLVI